MDEISYDFSITTPLLVEETFSDKKRLSGDFIKLDVPTTNGRIYLSEEGEKIAKSLEGSPVFFGIKGEKGGPHDRDRSPVGKVAKAIFDKTRNIIKGFVDVWNTPDFPDLVEEVREGWGLSIGGKIKSFVPMGAINKYLKPIGKAIGMVANHLQLLKPSTPRGDPDATVKNIIPVQETFNIDPSPFDVFESEDGKEELKKIIKEALIEVEEERKAEESKQEKPQEKKTKKKRKTIKRKKITLNIIHPPDVEVEVEPSG